MEAEYSGCFLDSFSLQADIFFGTAARTWETQIVTRRRGGGRKSVGARTDEQTGGEKRNKEEKYRR